MPPTVPIEPFALTATYRPLMCVVERLLGLAALNELYRQRPADGRPFCDRALRALDIQYELSETDAARIPRSGPLIVVANHPYGALDGLVLASLLHRARADVKLVGNALLAGLPELRDLMLFVDPFGRCSQVMANARAVREMLRWLDRGGAVAIFPSGEVSHSRHEGQIVDSRWAPSIARVVRHTRSSVLPVYFEGQNGRLFRAAGRIHPLLRTALLPRELLKQRHHSIGVKVGHAIPFGRLEGLRDDEQMMSYLRLRTYALGGNDRNESAVRRVSSPAIVRSEIATPEPAHVIRDEVEALPKSQVLIRNESCSVCIGRASQLPCTLREIGRLREIAFRGAGEGSGSPRDLDEFDGRYLHVFVWHDERSEILGAYRVGPTDEIVPASGVAGLYTNTLFRYDTRLLDQIDPALELGRAFVRPEYQRDYGPLLLLWKGIATFVARNPRYRLLFGPVSISSDYRSLSRQILAQFLHATAYRRDLGQLVTARNPPAFLRYPSDASPLVGAVVRTLAEVGALLGEIERDRKGVPVLVRQYLKLNAKLLGFNVDATFGNVLDGLMLVDLTEVDRAILFRYMGSAAATSFLAHHGVVAERRAS